MADGRVEGVALQLMASYGDLRDCRKVYFGLTDEPTHRIVYRLLTNRSIEIIEVVAVEQREEGYVYLLAAQRLGRLPSESKKRFDRTHQTVISRRGRSRRS